MDKAAPDRVLRHVRLKEQAKKRGTQLPIPQSILLKVIGNGTRGSPKSFLLDLVHTRILFNCGEGTQRIVSEQKFGLSRLEHVFVTYGSWENLGGLLGICLTVQDAKVPKLTIHGPPGVEKCATMAASFAQLHSLKVEKKQLSSGPFTDPGVTITSIPIHACNVVPSSGAVKKPRLDLDSTDVAYAYVCTFTPPPRKVNIEKCVEKGIPSGPLIGQMLKTGSITLKDGTIVTKEEILDTAMPIISLVVVECPRIDFVSSLITSEALRLCDGYNIDTVSGVIHFTPSEVMEDTRYKEWMKLFPSTTKHIVLNGTGREVSVVGPYKSQAWLNLIHDKVFTLLYHQRKNNVQPSNLYDTETNILYGETTAPS